MTTGHFDVCPSDDSLHVRYHRRARILFGAARSAAVLVLVFGTLSLVALVWGLWAWDIVILRRAVAGVVAASVGTLGVRYLSVLDIVLYKNELARLLQERTSVASSAERFLRSYGREELSD